MANMMTVMRLTKDFGNNVRGEVCGFSPVVADHIAKHNGGERLANIEVGVERWDLATAKVIKIAAK
jgi:hypothetical protein